MITLKPHQLSAIEKLRNGCILCGGVGSGKSLTSLGYYYKENGGRIVKGQMVDTLNHPQNLVIITTARKRDLHEWDHELLAIHMSVRPEGNYYDNKVFIDSWNNIGKYIACENAFFIFDEQRVVGTGAWVKAFYKIVGRNKWILLSATPGDTWMDYVPVFVANGFFKNKTQFTNEHVIYNYHVSFPQVFGYLGEQKLERLRRQILVEMDYEKRTIQHHEMVLVGYDHEKYKEIFKTRISPYEKLVIKGKTFDKPIENASEFCSVLRRIVNSDPSRVKAALDIIRSVDRIIVFYNFDFELEILRNLDYGPDYVVTEWNGHKHEKIPDSKKWVYLIQYNAGSEGWECITTNKMLFYSENYSYRMMEQSSGRIDRNNTPFIDLYYWHLRSSSSIDLAINRALTRKKRFNASAFAKNN